MTATALPPPLPRKTVRRAAYDKRHPNLAWRSALSWCLDTWPGAFCALAIAGTGESLLSVLISAGAPAGLQIGQIGVWLLLCAWTLNNAPKYSALFIDCFNNPAPYFLLRCELMGVKISGSPPDGTLVQARWNRNCVSMSLGEAESQPWESLQKLPQLKGKTNAAAPAQALTHLLNDTLEQWRGQPDRPLSRHIDYSVSLKASCRRR